MITTIELINENNNEILVVTYNEDDKSVSVVPQTVKSAELAKEVEKYLTTKREYIVVDHSVGYKEDDTDSTKAEKAKPVDNMFYFELALSGIAGSIDDVIVDWDSQETLGE